MALPAQKLAALAETSAAEKTLQHSARGISERFWLLLLGGLLVAAVVVGQRLVRTGDPHVAALDAAPVDDETSDTEEDEAVKAAAEEPTEDWSKVSRRLVG